MDTTAKSVYGTATEQRSKTVAKAVIECLQHQLPRKCPHCVGRKCEWYGTGVCLGGVK